MGDRYTVLKGGKLIDGNEGPPVEKSVIVIKGDRIEAEGGKETIVIAGPKGAKQSHTMNCHCEERSDEAISF